MLKLVNFAMHHVDAAYPANSRLEINETLEFNRKNTVKKSIHNMEVQNIFIVVNI